MLVLCIIANVISIIHVLCGAGNSFRDNDHVFNICPMSYKCNRTSSEVLEGRLVPSDCCSECSCFPDCGLTLNCCYKEMDNFRLVESGQIKCIDTYVSLQKLRDEPIAYYMVDTCPPRSNHTCGDHNVTTIGDPTLHPVWSGSKIYKNIECAKCHGDDHYNVMFQTQFVCIIDWRRNIDPFTLFYQLQNQILSNCNVYYIFSRPERIRHWRCPKIFYDTCRLDDKTMQQIHPHIAAKEIRDACKSDLVLPFTVTKHTYKNEFCALCNLHVSIEILRMSAKSASIYGDAADLVLLLDTHEEQFLSASDLKLPKQLTACSNETNECRPLYCQSGFIQQQDKCRPLIKKWKHLRPSIMVELIPRAHLTLEELSALMVDLSVILRNEQRFCMPWQNWNIVLINICFKNSSDTVPYFVAELSKFIDSFFLDEFLTSIKDNLKQPWSLNLNGTELKFDQRLHKHVYTLTTDHQTYHACLNSTSDVQARSATGWALQDPFTINFETHECPHCVQHKINMRTNYRVLYITELFFCKQIEYNSSEFEMFGNEEVLLLKNENIYLFQLEFEILQRHHEQFARVCIERTAFYNDRTNEGFTNSMHPYLPCLTYILIQIRGI